MADDRERARNESGQFNDRLPPETVLDVFDRRDDLARPVTAGDVQDALGIAQRTALNKLNELVAAGSLDSRTVGARARVFWRPIPADDRETRLKRLSNDLAEPIVVGETVYENGDTHPFDGDDSPESSESVERNQSGPERAADPADTGDTPEHVERDVSAESVPESVEGVNVDALDLPGTGDDLRRRQAAVRAVLAHLREQGEARTADLKEIAWRADGGSYADADSLWKNCVYNRALKPLDVVESSGPSGKWRWVGPTAE